MKRIYLSLLPCLASLLASAQEPLNGDSLASDFRYLVKELAATHPDPYSGFGGKVFFYEQAFHLENELRRTPGTKQTFFEPIDKQISVTWHWKYAPSPTALYFKESLKRTKTC